MRFGLLLSLGAALVAVLAMWLMFGGSPTLSARYALGNCRNVALRDVDTGRLVAGVADLLVLPDGDTLVVSAYDRGDETLPFGGLFATSLLDLERGSAEVAVTPLIKDYLIAGGVHPHGIAYDRAQGHLALINTLGSENAAVIDVIEQEGEDWVPVVRHTHEALCRANDLVFDVEGNLLITRDRAQCGLSIIDSIPFYPTGVLLSLAPDGSLRAGEERYYLPNGIVMGPSDVPIIAETRAERLTGDVELPIPGGPDGMTVDDRGGIVIAVHPSLWQVYLYLNGFAFSSPSRVVRYSQETGALEVLFEDPSGRVLSAVGIGLLEEDRLYLGSLVEDGIAICEPG